MTTWQVDILNPKAKKLLKDLADMNLISIRNPADDGFLKIVNKLRKKAKNEVPDVREILAEVNSVRSARYARAKK